MFKRKPSLFHHRHTNDCRTDDCPYVKVPGGPWYREPSRIHKGRWLTRFAWGVGAIALILLTGLALVLASG